MTENDIELIKSLPDNSIVDREIIRKIALYGLENNDSSLYVKIKKEFEFAGLYPYLQIFNENK